MSVSVLFAKWCLESVDLRRPNLNGQRRLQFKVRCLRGIGVELIDKVCLEVIDFSL